MHAWARTEAAVGGDGSVLAVLALLLTREEIVRTSLTIVRAAFAVLHIGGARRARACLHALHHTGRTG
ncbi:hypothetical protein [Kocuria sp. KH4]